MESCTILTTDPNEAVSTLHNRMPVILATRIGPSGWAAGGDETPAYLSKLQHLFRPYDGKKMKLRPVSTYVNSPRNEGEACVERVGE